MRYHVPPPRIPAAPTWSVAAGALGTLFASLLCRVAGVPLEAPVAVAAIAGVSLWLRDRSRMVRRAVVAFHLGGCGFAAAWSTWTGFLGYTWAAVIALAGAWAVGSVLVQTLAPVGELESVPGMHFWEDPQKRKLVQLLNARLGVPKDQTCTIKTFGMWPNDAGYTAQVEFPTGRGITVDQVQGVIPALAAEMQLQSGCTIRVAPGDHHGAAVFDVALVHNFDKDVQFDPSCRPRSIRDPLPIGRDGADQPVHIDLWQTAACFCAKRGGGKSVFLHNVIGQLAQCKDTLIWFIDLKGGATAAPWMTPFAKGAIPNSIVDWIARDPDEALNMASAAYAIALARAEDYSPLMVERNLDVLPVAADLPAITIIVDEGHRVFGGNVSGAAAKTGELLTELLKIGRSVCVNVVFTTQRGTLSYLSSDLKALAGLKIVGQVESQNEIGLVLDWATKGVRASDLTGQGQFFMRVGHAAPTRLKTSRIMPEHIVHIAQSTSTWRPELDGPGVEVGGEIYSQRWERAAEWLRHLAHGQSGPATPLAPGAQVVTLPARRDAYLSEEFLQSAVASLPAIADWPVTEDGDGAFGSVNDVARAVADSGATPERVRLATGVAFVYEFVLAAGASGAKTGEIVEAVAAAGLSTRRATVSEWLTSLHKGSLVRPVEGVYATWTAVDDGQAAA